MQHTAHEPLSKLLERGYRRDYIGDYYTGVSKRDDRSLDYGTHGMEINRERREMCSTMGDDAYLPAW